ncbi:hypothetical protein GCM10009665_58380 [Kitasatospora nipponensis]|uniref:Uncharacterized protein n=1 Tax=Kitasatospora nipponensis TaxID=258049 RepID=A0ABN1WQQ2_9ACTN
MADPSADCWRGRWRREVRDHTDDGRREYDDAVPIVATTLELLAARGPLGPIRWPVSRAGSAPNCSTPVMPAASRRLHGAGAGAQRRPSSAHRIWELGYSAR